MTLRSETVANVVGDAETTTVVIDMEEIVRTAEIEAEAVLLFEVDDEADVVVLLATAVVEM